MTMTRKDFISIATAIDESIIKDSELFTREKTLDKQEFIRSMCIILKANNERFDSSKFIDACYNSSE